jgi:hypothetical protein
MDDSGGFGAPPPPPPPSAGGGGGDLPIAQKTPSKIINEAFSTFQSNWQQLVTIGLIAAVATLVVGLILGAILKAIDNSTAGSTIVALVTFGLFLVVSLAITGAVTRLVASDIAGSPISIQDSISYGLTHVGPILVVSLIVFAVILVELVVGVLIARVVDASAWLVLVFLGALFLALMFSLSIPALVVEGQHGADAVKRSWDLVKSAFGHSLGTFALAYLVVIAAGIVVAIIGSASDVLLAILNFLLQVVLLPFFSLVLVLLYVNLRVKSGSGLTRAQLRDELARTA